MLKELKPPPLVFESAHLTYFLIRMSVNVLRQVGYCRVSGDEGVYLERRDLLTEESRYLRSSTGQDGMDEGFGNRIRARETISVSRLRKVVKLDL